MYPDLVSEPSTVSPLPKIRNGMVWYAAILPALGLFLENYALNKYLGMLIWGIVILARPAACLADRYVLLRSGAVGHSEPIIAFFPTIYIFKRCFDLKQNTAVAVVCLISLSYGIIGNGFVVGLSMSDDKALDYVKSKYAYSVAGVQPDNEILSFDEAIGKTLSDVRYEVTCKGDERTVSVTGKSVSTDDKYELRFRLVHDGFTLTEFTLSDVIKNGNTLKDDARSDALKEILVPDHSKDKDSAVSSAA